MKTTRQTKHTPQQKAGFRKADKRGSKMLDVDAKREELAMKRMMREGV